MILIVTNKEDAHPTPVIDILSERNIPFFRLNTESLLTDYVFNWWNDDEICDFYLENLQNGLKVFGSQITAVWDRRPEKPSELPITNEENINKHNLEEALEFLCFFRYYIKDIPSIGSIANDRSASSKMLQMKIAQEVGLKVPASCFSNRKNDILKFAKSYLEIIIKSIDSGNIWDEEKLEEYVFYAKKVLSKDLVSVPEESFSQTVSFVQNYIEKDYELRITIVGQYVFCCKIDSQKLDTNTGKIDWRQGYEHGLKHEIIPLDNIIAEKCKKYLQKMGLNFGCFDFVVTPQNEYVFLECNPNGQWLWVELETKAKIAEAIANFLINPTLN